MDSAFPFFLEKSYDLIMRKLVHSLYWNRDSYHQTFSNPLWESNNTTSPKLLLKNIKQNGQKRTKSKEATLPTISKWKIASSYDGNFSFLIQTQNFFIKCLMICCQRAVAQCTHCMIDNLGQVGLLSNMWLQMQNWGNSNCIEAPAGPVLVVPL